MPLTCKRWLQVAVSLCAVAAFVLLWEGRRGVPRLTGEQRIHTHSAFRQKAKNQGHRRHTPSQGGGSTKPRQKVSGGVLRSAVLPPALPSDRMLDVGIEWYRYGKPWLKLQVESVALVFQCLPGPRAQLVAFAMNLDGVFAPSESQYLAVWVHEHGHMQAAVKLQGQELATASFPGTFCDGQLNLATVRLTAVPATVSVSCEAVTGAAAAGVQGRARNAAPSPSPSSSSSAVSFDSGIYLGNLQDKTYLSDMTGIPRQLDSLRGRVHAQILVNGRVQGSGDGGNGSTLDHGVTDEAIGAFLTVGAGRVNLSDHLVDAESRRPPLGESDATNGAALRCFPVVSAVSDSHYTEMAGLIASVHRLMPLRGILIYDLGLIPRYTQALKAQQRTALRKFPERRHPELIADLYTYRFKPVLIFGAVQMFGGAIYADSSIRFKLPATDLPHLRNDYGAVFFAPTGISPLHAFTHDGMLRYLGLTRGQVTGAAVVMGGLSIWTDRWFAVRILLWHWFRCTLDPQCIAPAGARLAPCSHPQPTDVPGTYLGCHRYDQSALSSILLKAFQGRKDSLSASGVIVDDATVSKFAEVRRK